MKITGVHTLPMPRERAYDALQDPVLLARCMPGCESLEASAPGEYSMKMKLALAAMTGEFTGRVCIAGPNRPESFRLTVEGRGKIGFMKGEGWLRLSEQASGTEVAFDGEVQVGGAIAAVGERLIDTASRMMIRRFFEKMAEEASRAEGAKG